MQVGSSRFVNSYPGARRGPNAIFRVTTSRGPNCGSIELVAQTTNYVGIAPKAEIVACYGMHYDLARQMSEDVLQQDKRFRGSLEQLFQKNAASAGLGQDATNPALLCLQWAWACTCYAEGDQAYDSFIPCVVFQYKRKHRIGLAHV